MILDLPARAKDVAQLRRLGGGGHLAEQLRDMLKPRNQQRRKKYEENPRLAWDILEAGTEQARKAAGETMEDVRAAMGMSLDYEPLVTKDSKESE